MMDVLSYALSKKYTDEQIAEQKLKVAKVEKELNDYKSVMAQVNINQEAKQKTAGYGVISLPPNAAEGQVSGVVRGETLTNLADNGENNSNWVVNGSSIIVESGIKIIGGNASNNVVLPVNAKPATVYTLIYTVREVTTDSQLILSSASLIGKAILALPKTIGRHSVSLVSADTITYNQIRLQDNESTLGTYIIIDDVMLLEGDYTDRNIPYINDTKSTVSASRLKSVGKNLFDGEWERGGLGSTTGVPTDENEMIRSKFIKVMPNTQYYALDPEQVSNNARNVQYLYEYDINKNFIQRQILIMIPIRFTTSMQTRYVRFRSQTEGVAGFTIGDYKNYKTMLSIGEVVTPYEPYTESIQYITAKDEEGKTVELRSLPNGTKDEINVTDRKLIKRIGEKSNIANGMVIDFADMAEGGTYYAWNEDGETETGTKGDTLGIDATTLIYQLAQEQVIPVQVSGTLVSYPSGTVYIEPYVADAGIYTDKMEVLYSDLPIKALEKISKVDFESGLETEPDIAEAIIAEDKLSFTHPDLTSGDIVFFVYEHGAEGTIPETEVEYYDSRYVVKDDVTGKFYKWNVKVSNGTPTIEVVEV